MANLRYLFLIIMVVFAAVMGVLWQEEDDTPTISFTHSNVDNDVVDTPQPNTEQRKEHSNPLNATLTEPGDALLLRPNEYVDLPPEETLTDEQLAERIRLAQEKLAQIEAINARKQEQVAKILAESGTAEQPLIEAEIAYVIGGWRNAWQRGDAQAYFAFYSDAFTPNTGQTFEQWKAQRVKRLNPDLSTELELSNFNVEIDPETKRSLVTFTQRYRSGNNRETHRKRLIMALEQGNWKIVSETSQ